MLTEQLTESAAMKAASAVQGVGLGSAIASGTVAGLTQAQWAVIGIIGGLFLGAIGTLAKIGLDFYFQHQHLKVARGRAGAPE